MLLMDVEREEDATGRELIGAALRCTGGEGVALKGGGVAGAVGAGPKGEKEELELALVVDVEVLLEGVESNTATHPSEFVRAWGLVIGREEKGENAAVDDFESKLASNRSSETAFDDGPPEDHKDTAGAGADRPASTWSEGGNGGREDIL